MDLDQREGAGAERKEGQPGIPGEVSGDRGQPTAGDRYQLLPPGGHLAGNPDPGAEQRREGGVAEEEVEDLPVVPLEARCVGPEEGVEVGHVADRLHEVEAEPHGGAVDDAVDDVVELIPHHEIKEKDRHPLGELLEEPVGEGIAGVETRPRNQGVDGPELEEALGPDHQRGGDDGTPGGGHQHQPPGLLLVPIQPVDHPESEAGGGEAGQCRERRRQGPGLLGEEEDVEDQEPEQDRQGEQGDGPELVPPAQRGVALEGADADPGRSRHQRHGRQAEQRAPGRDPVERQVVDGRAAHQDQHQRSRQDGRDPVAGRPAMAGIGRPDHGAHRSTTISRRASTSTGWPREIRSTTNR